MKRYISLCIALLGVLSSFAESISVPILTIEPGQTGTVSISLINEHTDLVSFQMDLTLPDGISINKAGCSLSSRFTDEDQELTIGKQGNNIYRLTSTSFALTPISGTSGEIITLSLTAAADFESGMATLSNIRFVTSGSQRVTLADFSFYITTGSPSPTITFADANVKALCVQNWDTNHDGELIEAEAAAVTDLGTVFYRNKTITSFDELQYFTGLTSIGESAFFGCSGLTSVTIPESVTSIGNSAFYGCSGLTSVTIPISVTSIGIAAFSGCSSLASVTINSNSIASSTSFLSTIFGTQVTELLFGDSVTAIGNSACYKCRSLASVTIPNSVTSIGQYAFSGCSGLTSVTIPESVTSIGNSAFYGCSGLTSVTIPISVTSIGIAAFSGCSGLTSIVVESGNVVYDSRNNCNAIIKTANNRLIAGCQNTIIPNSVTSIGEQAFQDCSGLTSVTIPNSVTSLGSSAFRNCSGLTSVTIPNSVTSIGSSAFVGCSGLTSIVVESGNVVYDSRYNCNAIIKTASNELIVGCNNTVIPNNLTSIGEDAFYNCSGLTSVTIPVSVTSIGTRAFLGCSGLMSVTIPISVTSIGIAAFSGCSSLTSVTVNIETPLTISSTTFSNSSYATLYVPAGSKQAYLYAQYWKEFGTIVEMAPFPAINFVDDKVKALCVASWDINGDRKLSEVEAAAVTDLGTVFKNNTTITSFDELQYFTGLTSIGESAFRGCSGLTSVTIPESVTSIGNYAFNGCSGLASVTIPNSVKSIGAYAFENCSGLTSVTIGNSVTSIELQAFADCGSLTKVIVNDIAAWYNISFGDAYGNPLYYAHHLYSDENTEITSLVIPNSVTSIGYSAFYGCSGLTSITIPNSVTSIGYYAFQGCSGIISVTINSNSIASKSYSSTSNLSTIFGTQVTEYIFGNSVTAIGNSACYKCSSLASVTIPNSVTSIGNYAFYNCSGLTSVTIPNSVTSIGDHAFYNCSGLTSVTIPNSVTSIEAYAFYNCSGLTSVTIPNSVTSIGNSTFYGCSGLTSVTIPNSVTSIGNSTFYGCSGLTSVTIPNSVTSIGTRAFLDCSGLMSVTIPNSVTSIGNGAFRNCSGLTSVTIPNSVTSIGDQAFYNCSGLTAVTIPNSVTSIGNYAFYVCSGLTSVTVEWETPITITVNTFSERANAILYVPYGSKMAYEAADYWNEFKAVVEMGASSPVITFADANMKALCVQNWDTNGDGELSEAETAAVTTLGEVFKGNAEITSFDELQYFTGLTEIADGAFNECTKLESVILPSEVTRIGNWAFTTCNSLNTITIPASVTDIGAGAFAGCINMISMTVDTENTVYDSREDCNAIIHSSTNTVVAGCKNMTIPEGVTSIGDWALNGMGSLTSVVLPSSLTSIGTGAFSWCWSLPSITIPANVTSIGGGAFEGCSNLTSVTVENPEPVAIGESTFSNRANGTLYVPYGSKDGYETADYWKDFNIVSWHNIIVNSNMEGDDTTCFFSKEDAGDPQPSIIVDGAGKDGSCGIVLNSADNPVNPWDTQFFVRLPQSLPAGTNYRVKFNYKASRNAEASTQMHTEPGNYIYWEGIGTLNFTTEWQTYEYMGVISSEQSPEDNMQTIAFNLSESNSATTYYFDNFVFEIDEDHITPVATVKTAPIGKILTYTGEAQELINAGTTDDGTMVYQFNWGGFSEAIPTASEVGVYTIEYKVIGSEGYVDSKTYTITAGILSSQMADLIVNGDMEGTDNVCFFSRENRLENDEIVPSTIVEGVGVDGSRGIVIQSIDNPSETWDTQFFIRLPQTLPAGTNYYISFDYKASQEASGFTGTHAEPSQYLWNGIGTINYTADWKHFELIGTVSAEQSPADNPMRTIAFDLAVTPTSTTYYFDNVVFEIDRNQVTPVAIVAEAPTPKELTYTGEAQELINPGEALGGMMQYSLDGTNYSTSIPTGTDAGEYTVYYKVVGDEDHSDSEVATVSVTIQESGQEIEPTDISQLDNAIYVEQGRGTVGNQGTLVISLKNAQNAAAYEFTLQLPDGITLATDDNDEFIYTLSGRHNGHTLTFNDNGNGLYGMFVYSSTSKPIADSDGYVLSFTINIADDVAIADHAVTIKNAKYSLPDGSTSVKMPETTGIISVSNKLLGDVNSDGEVDVADVVCYVNHLIGKHTPVFVEEAADVNFDGEYDVADVVRLVNKLIGRISTFSPAPSKADSTEEAVSLPEPE